MLRKWETPRAEVEEFMPNEYCSVCWGVACDIDKANKKDKYDPQLAHTPDHCGNETNQVVKDLNGDGIADIMQEIGTDGLGTLTCELYNNEWYYGDKDIATVKPGDYIYWTTSAGNRTWHHQGRVEESFPGHPNRS